MNRISQLILALTFVSIMIFALAGCAAEPLQGPIGLQGPAGEQGIQGPVGAQGEPGTQAVTDTINIVIPGAGIQKPGSIVVQITHGLTENALPPQIIVGLVTENGIIMYNEFIFGLQNYLEQVILGEGESFPSISFVVYDITPETFKIAVMSTESASIPITLRWWAVPAVTN